jgi:hypothetical protein
MLMTLVSLTRYAIIGSILFVIGVEAALGGCSTSKCVECDELAKIDRTRSLIEEPQPMEIVAPLDLLGGHEYLCILIRFRIEDDGTAVAAETVRAEPHPLLLRSALYSLYGTKFSVPEDDEDRCRE